MASDVQNRKTIREEFASLLETALVGSGLPAQAVYPYRVSDFKGRYSVVAVTSGKANRGKQAQVTRVSSRVNLEVHTFVLYSAPPVKSTGNATAGTNVVINISDTSNFIVGDVVTIEDESHTERATINAIVEDVSIRVATLTYSYTTPNVFWWTERDAEDREDLLEKMITDVAMDNDTNDTWAQLSFDGDTQPDPLVIGGQDYLHEIFPFQFQLHSD